ncbi:hypothetical protein HX867_30155 [Pseudomonas gingeri]|uniref:DUF6998 domain-containing protein n=1 Tax=Pseudomonas gingeri TaxID=117681 RepID=UPI0015A0BC05|nr:hypothetical protein [Pseudomonas gingeri]NVZ66379.1 hypothetical protein [Pseudomonas gingeri]NVZ76880.1 hypothetical protein [Pseudomonas gingeri]
MNLSDLSISELLKLHAAAIDELKNRGVLRTKNNPVGDYAEWLVSSALNLTLANNSAAGHDAESSDGKKIQIKARRITANKHSKQLGVIRNLEKNDFDELIAVIFNESYEIIEAYLIPHAVISKYGAHRAHVNGHILHLRGALLLDSSVLNISDKLNASNNALKSLVSLAGTGKAPLSLTVRHKS